MTTIPTRAALALALCAALAPSALAGDSFGVRFGKHSKKGGISIEWSSGPKHCPPPPVHCPPPRCWVPGHYETRYEKVWIEGCEERVWIAPVFAWRKDSCGRPFQYPVSGGHWSVVRKPGYHETRPVQVWVPAGWRDC